jgi:hypothetical protein
MTEQPPICIQCERTSDEVPLILMRYSGSEFWICPQHLPILIHKPAQLADKLPGAASFGPSEHHH